MFDLTTIQLMNSGRMNLANLQPRDRISSDSVREMSASVRATAAIFDCSYEAELMMVSNSPTAFGVSVKQ